MHVRFRKSDCNADEGHPSPPAHLEAVWNTLSPGQEELSLAEGRGSAKEHLLGRHDIKGLKMF